MPSVQSNQAFSSGGVVTLNCAYLSPITDGNTITVSCDVDNFAATQPLKVSDNLGNATNVLPTVVAANEDGKGAFAQWRIPITVGGSCTITGTAASPSNSSPFILKITEELPTTGVRASSSQSADFGSLTGSLTLTASQPSDITIGFIVGNGTPGAAPTAGSCGSNSCTNQQTESTQGSGVEQGLWGGTGGTCTYTVNGTGVFGLRFIAMTLIPGAAPSSAPKDVVFSAMNF